MQKLTTTLTRVWKPPESNLVKDILEDCVSLFKTQKLVRYGNSYAKISRLSTLRNIFTQECTGTKKCVRDLLINCVDSANKATPGSGIWIPKFILNNPELKEVGRVSSKEAMNQTLNLTENEKVKLILAKIPKTVSNTGKVVVKTHKGHHTKMELSLGYKFSPSLPGLFSKIIGTSELYLSDAEFLFIEGAPSSVGEITKLLEDCSSEKRNLVMIARSFPEDILSTLATNWLKKSLNIVPMIYGDRIENINLVADISATTGSIPVTPMMGDTLTMDLSEKMGFAKSVRISKNSLVLSSERDITLHLSSLYEKLKNLPDFEEEQRAILVDRIAGLSNELLTIELPDSEDNLVIREELEIALLYYNFLCYSAAKIVVDGSEHTVPFHVFETASEFAKRFIDIEKSIGGFLINKNL